MNKEIHQSNPSRSHLTKRGVKAAAGVTGLLASGLVTAGALSHESDDAPKVKDIRVTCELPVRSGDTMWGLADTFKVGRKNISVYHPGSVVAEKNPVYEMQPGDVAAAKIGAIACQQLGGEIGDPTHPDVIIE